MVHPVFPHLGHMEETVVVEACTNLANPVWTPVGTNTFAGDSTITSFFVGTGASLSVRCTPYTQTAGSGPQGSGSVVPDADPRHGGGPARDRAVTDSPSTLAVTLTRASAPSSVQLARATRWALATSSARAHGSPDKAKHG